jgi:hypothetical protein
VDDFLTVKQAAKEAGVVVSAIYNAIYGGKLIAVRRDPYLIRREDLANYRASARVGKPAGNQKPSEEPTVDH